MMQAIEHMPGTPRSARRFCRLGLLGLMMAVAGTIGCHSAARKEANKEFFTSGSREADQRATQRMARSEQLAGSGEGAGETDVSKSAQPLTGSAASATNAVPRAQGKVSLFDRLGGEKGLTSIVDDFTPRLLQDPRVNWDRIGVRQHGFSFSRSKELTWKPTPQNVSMLKKHIVEFLALATGGPAHYEGKEIKSLHAGMHISNPEFDAAIGDIKASLDKLQIPNTEQKELLAVIESTRPEIVTER